jgi:hypothetical protein
MNELLHHAPQSKRALPSETSLSSAGPECDQERAQHDRPALRPRLSSQGIGQPRRPGALAANVASVVTLLVYGWDGAQPGTLSWQYPDVPAALLGAKALRNASRWAILAGELRDLDQARQLGSILHQEGGDSPP